MLENIMIVSPMLVCCQKRENNFTVYNDPFYVLYYQQTGHQSVPVQFEALGFCTL